MGIVFNGLENEGKSKMTEKVLNIDVILTDKGTQSRVELHEPTVAEYCENILLGDIFPAIVVFHDGTNYFLADGFHRYFAHHKAKKVSILSKIIRGTLRDAILYSLSANNQNGLRPTIADRRKAVMIMLEDFEWENLSNREIARICGVTHPFVAKVRIELEQKKNPPVEEKQEKVTKNTTKELKVDKKNSKVEILPPADGGYDKHMVDTIISENTRLSDRLAIKALAATQEEKDLAKQTIEELREDLKNAYIEIDAITKSRDSFQNECAQLKKQLFSLQRKLKQYETA
jgi:hypothetical protein